MSQNFFAALDDSGDEGAPVAKKEQPKKPPQKPVANANKKTVVEPSKQDNRRRPNHNDRNTKHGRGGRAPARDGKRAYDRRSGTGRGKEIKKGGGGARNWGNDKNEARRNQGKVVEGEEGAAPAEASESQDNAPPAEGEEPKAEEPVVEPEPEPEDKTMTLAEYMASKGGKKEETVREVESEFKNVQASKKVEEDFFSLGGGKQKKNKKKVKETQTIQANFRVANPNSDSGGRGRGGRGRGDRDRGGRGGRGRGDRGGRGGGRGRGGRSNQGGGGGINVQDTQAFPSL